MRQNKKKSGFSIIEMVVVVAIISIISVILSIVLSSGGKSFRAGMKRVNYNESAVKAQRDFERYVRGATQIVEADGTKLTFLAYLRADTKPAPTKVGYYLDGSSLKRYLIYPVAEGDHFIYPESNKEISLVVGDVVLQDTYFSYFNDNNDPLSLPITINQIKMIGFNIGIDSDAANYPDASLQATKIQLRNLKNNL